MADRYQTLTATRPGKALVRTFGLPNPTPLDRYTEGGPVVSGTFLVGGSGRLNHAVTEAVAAAGGAPASAKPGTQAGVGPALTAPHEARLSGLVFDATGIESSDQLIALHEFFSPLMRSLKRCARVVVLGTTPSEAGSTSAAVAQRALEGFTRSVGKEIGRGGTSQLVYVGRGAEDRIGSTLSFLLSAKSAYVSGQVIRIGTDVGAAQPDGAASTHPLAGRVALVTGAARGIGESIVRVLRRDGASVVGLDVPQAASELMTLMDALGGDALAMDITSVDAAHRIARDLRELHGGVDIVVHNAGITRDKKLANMSGDRWASVIDVNLTAPQRITEFLLEDSLIRPNGRVVGVASIAGIAGNAGQANYATSKAGIIGLVDALAPTAAGKAVTVNAVAPGFIETQMTARIPVLIREAGRRMNSMSQGGLPVDVAETVAWLAAPGSHGVTGNTVRVCGQSLLGA